MKPVPRTAAVVVGVFTSNFESVCVSFCTLVQVRPIVWPIEIEIPPLGVVDASSTLIVVAGSSSMVEPSKNVTTA